MQTPILNKATKYSHFNIMFLLHVNQTKLQKAINGLRLDAQHRKIMKILHSNNLFQQQPDPTKMISNNDLTQWNVIQHQPYK